MIKIIDGDLFESDAKFIAHQVNCMGVMGSGVALQVKQKFPHVYKEYRKIASSEMLGNIQVVACNPEYLYYPSGSMNVPQTEQFICNLFAQDKCGYGQQFTSEEALKSCFNILKNMTFEKNNNFGAKIAMPYMIGCRRGGAKWENVYGIIEETFKDVEVELWRFDKG